MLYFISANEILFKGGHPMFAFFSSQVVYAASGGAPYERIGGAPVLVLIFIGLLAVPMAVSMFFKSVNERDDKNARKQISAQIGIHTDGDLFADYWLLRKGRECSIISLIQAFFVRWVNEGYLETDDDVDEDLLLHTFQVNRPRLDDDPLEAALYDIVLKPSNGAREMKCSVLLEWITDNSVQLIRWYRNVERHSYEQAKAKGYVAQSMIPLRKSQNLTESGIERLAQLLSLKEQFAPMLAATKPGEAKWQEIGVYATLLQIRQFFGDSIYEIYDEQKEGVPFDHIWHQWEIFSRLGQELILIANSGGDPLSQTTPIPTAEYMAITSASRLALSRNAREAREAEENADEGEEKE